MAVLILKACSYNNKSNDEENNIDEMSSKKSTEQTHIVFTSNKDKF